MRWYKHYYRLDNGQIWGLLIEAQNFKEASKFGNMHAREHAREEHTQIEWQTTKSISKKA